MSQFIFNVRDYAAVGDGKESDTAAIQKAIDACAAMGGGKVLLPAGKYLSGTIFLRDNVTLYLSEGSEIIASTDIAQYPEITFYEGQPNYQEKFRVLIYAETSTNCGVSGVGTINGQDRLFWNPVEPENMLPDEVHYYKKEWRPYTIAFNRCEKVHVEGITIAKSSVYAVWLVECNDLRLQNVTVDHDFHGPNTDGFHLSSCHNALISGCSFYVGDDCIAVDDNGSTGSGEIVISDCIFESLVSAVRLYTNLDPWADKSIPVPRGRIENITIRNCIAKEARSLLNVVANNGTISDIVVSGFLFTQNLSGTTFFFLTQQGEIYDVDISHIIARSNGAVALMGDAPNVIRNVSLSHCRFRITPLRKKWEKGFPEIIERYYINRHSPWMLHFRYVRQLSLDHVQVHWNSDSIPAPPAWNYEFVSDLQESYLIN